MDDGGLEDARDATDARSVLRPFLQVSAWVDEAEGQLARDAEAELGRLRGAAEEDARALLTTMTKACLEEQQVAVERLVQVRPLGCACMAGTSLR